MSELSANPFTGKYAIADEFMDGPLTVVQIAPTDAGFSANEGCGTWSLVPLTGPQATSFGPGTWVVGVDIAPGRYQQNTVTLGCGC